MQPNSFLPPPLLQPRNTALGDLPCELLAETVSYVAVAESKELAASSLVGHRLVCGKFNILIVNNLCIDPGNAKLTTDGDEEHVYRMRLLSTEIVNWKINNKRIDHPLVRSLSETIDKLVLRMGPMDCRISEQLRQQYAKNLCDVVKGLGYECFNNLVSTQEEKYDKVNPECILSIAQAAVGGTQFLDRAEPTLQDVLSKKAFFLPSILETAVAANEANLVDRLLKRLVILYGEERSARAVAVAIRATVRLSGNTIRFLVFDFLKRHHNILGKCIRTSSVHLMKQDCIEYGNTGLLDTIMWWIWADEVPDRSRIDLRTLLTNYDIWCILRHPKASFINPHSSPHHQRLAQP
ncbi:hypothetical protein G6514_001881 [Epicoccum nigrum]|nr:hypothetical protein G6514_001881 [Epicoccum nigrum]